MLENIIHGKEIEMPKYCVSATVIGGKYIGVVEADSPMEAEEKGWELDRCDVSFCYQCVNECGDAEIRELHVELIEED